MLHQIIPGFNNNSNTLRIEDALNSRGNLFRQPFLHLQPPRVHFRNPCQLTQSQDILIWDVADVNLNAKRLIRHPSIHPSPIDVPCHPTFPVKGTRWCSHRENIWISLTMTISSWFSWNNASLITSTNRKNIEWAEELTQQRPHCTVDALTVAFRKEEKSLGISFWSLYETLSFWVLANAFKKRFDCFGHFL